MRLLQSSLVLTLANSALAFIIDEQEANKVLSRVRRFSVGIETFHNIDAKIFERSKYDGECIRETCSAEEYTEVLVKQIGQVGQTSWRNGKQPSDTAQCMFNQYYKCAMDNEYRDLPETRVTPILLSKKSPNFY